MDKISKSPEAFRTISEASIEVGVAPHVLRFWEGKFSQIKPLKRGGGRRFYRPQDIVFLLGLKKLLQIDGVTIKGVQKIIREHGIQSIRDQAEFLNTEEYNIEFEDDEETKIDALVSVTEENELNIPVIKSGLNNSDLIKLKKTLFTLEQAKLKLDKALSNKP